MWGLKMMWTVKVISSDGKYWHHFTWYHTVVVCLEICEFLIRKRIGFLRNALGHLESSGHILSQSVMNL